MRRALRGLLTVLAATALALTTVAATAPAASAADEIYPVPSAGYWEVRGHGWGHGKGLSQWGAQGAAHQGLSPGQILDFYYPGTSVQNVGDRVMRVQLRSLGTPTAMSFWSTAGTGGRLAVGSSTDTGKVTVRLDASGWTVERPGKPAVRQGGDTLTISAAPAGYGTGVVVAGAGATTGTWYHGTIRLVRVTANTFDVVNDVPMQLYLYGVVPREMPASFHPAALQAQAVAARTYALSVSRSTGHYDLCDTTQCQVYGGRATVRDTGEVVTLKEDRRSSAAVDATHGHARWYAGRPAFTQFSSSNGGYSRGDANHPYLVARPDPYSGVAPGDPVSTWTDRLPVANVQRYCPAGGTLQRLVVTSRDGRGDLGGRVTGASVECSTGTAAIPNDEFTLRLGLRSTWWKPTTPPQPRYMIHLNNSFTGYADTYFNFGNPTDTFLVGDWNRDRVDTLAIRRGNTYYFRNSNTSGPAESVIAYGNPDDTVLVGDWDGDGVDTFAVRRGNAFHIKNSISSGYADRVIYYGNPGDVILVGDWDGDGADTLGVRRGNVYHLRNSLTSGVADRVVPYGNATDEVIVGDWDGNGTSTLGVIRR